jgi:peptidyl-prolyl cis-trans isomerase D
MSVIQKIRDKYAGFVIAFIALSLIAFILMDAFTGRGRAGGGLFSNRNTIGRVNGTKIDKRDFDKEIDMVKKMNSNAPYDQLVNQAWNLSVSNIIMHDEYERTGIAFTDKELNSVLTNPANPPMWMKQNFSDPNTGEYNYDQAMNYLKQVKQMKNDPRAIDFYEVYIQQQTIEQTLIQKYLSLVSNSVYVPKWLAEKQMADNNAISSISYVYVPYATINDTAVSVTDDDVKSYVRKHEPMFKVEEESRTISYVTFDATPSSQDSLAVKNQLMQYRNEFATTKDEKAFIERVGSDFGYDSTYFSAKAIQHVYKDSIIKAGVGNIFGPYQDGKELVLAKLTDSRILPDSVKCRHILIGADAGLSDSAAHARADSIAAAIAKGANFDSLESRYTSDKGAHQTKGVMTYASATIQGPDFAPEFAKFILFDGKPGAKKVVKTQYGWHYIEILEHKDPQPAYKIAYLAKAIVPSQETVDATMSDAQRFAASSRNEKSFNENLLKFRKAALQSLDIHSYDGSIGGLGENRPFVRWIFENDLGDVSEPFDFKDKFVVALINNVQEKGIMNVAKARPIAEPFIRSEKKAKKIISEKFKGNSLESYAQSSGSAITRADSLAFVSSFIPGVGPESKVIGTAFNPSQVNKVTEPIAGTNGVFAVRTEIIGARPSGGTIEDLQKNMEGQLKGISYGAVGALKKAAKIKDYRFDFF